MKRFLKNMSLYAIKIVESLAKEQNFKFIIQIRFRKKKTLVFNHVFVLFYRLENICV